MSGTLVTVVIDPEIECVECGAWIPADADRRNDHHDDECVNYVQIMTYADAESMYEDMLNDIAEPVTVFSLTFDAGTLLKRVDPIAFREMLLCYADEVKIEFVNHY